MHAACRARVVVDRGPRRDNRLTGQGRPYAIQLQKILYRFRQRVLRLNEGPAPGRVIKLVVSQPGGFVTARTLLGVVAT